MLSKNKSKFIYKYGNRDHRLLKQVLLLIVKIRL